MAFLSNLSNLPQNIGPIAQAAQSLQMGGEIPGMGEGPPQRQRGVLESFGELVPNGRNGQQRAYTPGIGGGDRESGGEGFLSRAARAMHRGRNEEVAAQAQETRGPLGTLAAGRGPSVSGNGAPAAGGATDAGTGYGEAMGGVLGRLAQLSREQDGPAGDSTARQIRRLGLGMMAYSGQPGDGLTGIGTAGLKAMEANDARAKARRQAEADLLGMVYDHLQSERKFQAGRSDEAFERQMALRKIRRLSDPETVIGPDGEPRLVRYDDFGGVHPVEGYRPAPDLGAPKEVTGPDGQPMLVRFDDYGRAVPVEGYRPAPSDTQREVASMIARGVPRGWASDVAAGHVDTEVDDFGTVRAINRATGEVRTLASQGGGQRGAGREPVAGAEGDRSAGVFGRIEEGTGPWSGMRAAGNAVVGPFFEGTWFEDTAEARSAIRNFGQIAKQALVNNERFPVYEQKIVAQLLPDPDKFWADPDAERAKLQELRSFLQNRIEQNRRSITSGNITSKERGRLANQIESIERVLGLMGSPGQADSGGLPEGVPQGSRKMGTLDGAPVYETPDGRRLVVE